MGTLKKTEGKGELMNAGGQLHQEGVNKVVSKKRGNGQSCTLQEDNYFLVRYFKKMFPTSNTRVLVYLSCVEFFAACVIAIQAPFYPEVVSCKNFKSLVSLTSYTMLHNLNNFFSTSR